ncbi:MAG: hypothetical protein MIO92_05505 [Methanosarcinaceae archaeon]|nr:hypothetical protein [Methanosarcinaceae archaeon]
MALMSNMLTSIASSPTSRPVRAHSPRLIAPVMIALNNEIGKQLNFIRPLSPHIRLVMGTLFAEWQVYVEKDEGVK